MYRNKIKKFFNKRTIIPIILIILLCFTTFKWQQANNDLSPTLSLLESTQNVLQADQAQLTATQKELTDTLNQLGDTTSKLLLYQDTMGISITTSITPDVGVDIIGTSIKLNRNLYAHNPTWAELMDFLNSDNTSAHLYGIDLCGWFAEQIFNNAEKQNIRSALVIIHFEEGAGHALNAFKTVDRGLVFIDCNPRRFIAFFIPFVCRTFYLSCCNW